VCELSAHSRSINALVCHPLKSFFATCSDDTFVHIFSVTGGTTEKIDVSIHVGSRVNDLQLCGLAFSGNSLIAAPYDYKKMAVWTNIL